MATAERPLRRGEWITLAALGVPTFAFALAITTVSTYLPVLASIPFTRRLRDEDEGGV